MKRSRSFVEAQNAMSASSPLLSVQPQRGTLICLPPQETSLSLASSKRPSPNPRVAVNVKEQGQGSTESDSSMETWEQADYATPCAQDSARNREENGEHCDTCRTQSPSFPTLKDIACEPVDMITETMCGKPQELFGILKSELREILNGNGGVQQREEFAKLQNWVLGRKDLSPQLLMRANRSQVEILVAIKTGIQAFLHPGLPIAQGSLVDIFFYKRCRNVACQSELPADGCECEVCRTKNGFCSICMCTICSKFDFFVNTCRWIGCDVCSHWTHTDCAIRFGQIAMGTLPKRSSSSPEMLFKCKGCNHTSELFGWVKDVCHTCGADWESDDLMNELDTVRRIFHGSEDPRGKGLYLKSEELLKKLNDGMDRTAACKEIQIFFKEQEANEIKELEAENIRIVEPQEVCDQIGEVVQEAILKLEAVADEKVKHVRRPHATLEACEKGLEDKKRELQELQCERLKRKQEVEELEMMIRLKVAEADMFQTRADDARREAEKLRRLVAEKTEKCEEEYSRYLKLRLNEVDAEHRALFEKIQPSQENSQLEPDVSQMSTLRKIQQLLRLIPRKESVNVKESCDTPL